MGFGTVFIGIASLLFFRLIPIEAVGFYVAYRGLSKLSAYGKHFLYASYMAIALIAFSMFDIWVFVGKITNAPAVSELYTVIAEYVHTALVCAFLILLSLGLKSIADDCDYIKGKKRALRILVFTCVYVFLVAVVAVFPMLSAYMALPIMLYNAFLILFSCFTVYGFYMMIVTDSILEKERIAIEAFDKRFGRKK